MSHSTQLIPQGPQRLSCSVLQEGQGNQWEVEEMGEDPLHKGKAGVRHSDLNRKRVLLSCKEISFKINPERREGLKQVNERYYSH